VCQRCTNNMHISRQPELGVWEIIGDLPLLLPFFPLHSLPLPFSLLSSSSPLHSFPFLPVSLSSSTLLRSVGHLKSTKGVWGALRKQINKRRKRRNKYCCKILGVWSHRWRGMGCVRGYRNITDWQKTTVKYQYRPVVTVVHSVTRQPFTNTLSAAAGEHRGSGTVVVSWHAHPRSVLQHQTDITGTAAFYTVAIRRAHVWTAAVVVVARITACKRTSHTGGLHRLNKYECTMDQELADAAA